MLRRPLRRRAGFSLVEVLVAIFILAAGLLALFTLFPLGAVQMGKALRDDRSQQCALQADGKVREWWRAQVVEGTPVGPTSPSVVPCVAALDSGAAGFPAQPAAAGRASYPVLLDPIGFASYAGHPKQLTVAGVASFPRRTLTIGGAAPVPIGFPAVLPIAGLADSMEFAPDGTPADRDGLAVTATGQPIFRTWRQNWAAVIQRPDNATRGLADLKILVFDQRVPGRNPIAPVNNEQAYSVAVTVGLNQVLFPAPATNDQLGLRQGSWVMDGTIQVDGTGNGIRNAQFYQVNSVAEIAGGVLVELVNPILPPRGEGAPASYTAQLYVLNDLIDVYDRPQLTPSGYSKQTP